MERVRPDYSIPLTLEGVDKTLPLDPKFDFIREFGWLGYSIINIVTETGINRVYTTLEQGRKVAEHGGIPLVELEWICESEYDSMVEIMANDLDDSWLE